MLRSILLNLSTNQSARRWVTRSRFTAGMVRRFIAGNSLKDAIPIAQELNGEGFVLTMDNLGEAVKLDSEAEQALFEYKDLLSAIEKHKLDSTISVKPTQLGMAIDFNQSKRRILTLAKFAKSAGTMVEIDMEDSHWTEATLELHKVAFEATSGHVRVCLQSYLHRSLDDLKELIQVGASVRIVKGAYKEPPQVALQRKKEVDKAYVKMLELAFSEEALHTGFYPAVATHDEELIEKTKELADKSGLRKDRFEFQLLFGIKTSLQQALIKQGYKVRIYLPYGSEWYPYYMRRLAERPANLFFLLKNLVR